MPVEKAWPIAQVVEILREYDFTHQRRVSFEYIVMSGLNDSPPPHPRAVAATERHRAAST